MAVTAGSRRGCRRRGAVVVSSGASVCGASVLVLLALVLRRCFKALVRARGVTSRRAVSGVAREQRWVATPTGGEWPGIPAWDRYAGWSEDRQRGRSCASEAEAPSPDGAASLARNAAGRKVCGRFWPGECRNHGGSEGLPVALARGVPESRRVGRFAGGPGPGSAGNTAGRKVCRWLWPGECRKHRGSEGSPVVLARGVPETPRVGRFPGGS